MRHLPSLKLCLLGGWLLAGACNIDLSQQDSGTTVDAAAGTGATTGAGGAGGASVKDAGSDIDTAGVITGCSLLQASCPSGLACFPFPFESNNPTLTACGYPGTGDELIPCQSQLECDGTSICSAPGNPASVCLPRCDLSLPYCQLGSDCVALPAFSGVGACWSF